MLDAELGYRFLASHLALKIEKNSVPVAYGFNGYNRHFLNHRLQAGDYSLVLYVPIVNSTLVSCIPFSIRLDARSVLRETTLFGCSYPPLPDNLNAKIEDLGYVHLQTIYLVDPERNSFTFTTTGNSIIRSNFIYFMINWC